MRPESEYPNFPEYPGPSPQQIFYNTRDFQLAGSDWTQLPDSPLTDEEKSAWAKYRQELRDLPDTKGKETQPFTENWPVAPALGKVPHTLASKLGLA